MRMPTFIAAMLDRRIMRRGMRAAALERGKHPGHVCVEHYGEGRWYSDGSLRFTCGLCGCTKRAKPPWISLRAVGEIAFWCLVVGAVCFLAFT